ncbi:MAG: prepilin peptidase [Marinicaulis sp.]|nr:prepilin peptidase [Marinicaulis sp.]NNL89264.1 prepilin peptidase [Marinicaulis sp.]
MDLMFAVFAAFFGLIIGSFLNVIIHRGPRMWGLVEDENRQGDLFAPGSYCPSCRVSLKAVNLVPLLSYAMQGGKCSGCSAPISSRYPLVELAGAASAVIAITTFGPTLSAFAVTVFFLLLIALAVIDWETGFLPDMLTVTLGGFGLMCAVLNLFVPLADALIGAVAGFGIFWIIGAAFQKLRGLDGLGLGDAKLLAALGAWLGWQALAPIVFFGSVAALVGYYIARARGAELSKQTEIPFGPALAAAGASVMIARGFGFTI